MKSIGIQPNQLPYRDDGTLDNSVFKQFLALERKKERLAYQKRSRVGVPGPYDVLFGKGSRFQNHIGEFLVHNSCDFSVYYLVDKPNTRYTLYQAM